MHRMLLGAVVMSTLGAVPVFLVSAQFFMISEDLSLDERDLGVAVGVFFAFAALGSVPAGTAADRLGPRHARMLAGLLATTAALFMAMFVSSMAGLVVGLAVAGLSNAALQMTANAALARRVPPDRRGFAFGVKQSAIPLAVLLGGLAVPAVGLLVGWRWTFGILAIACATVVVGGGPGRRSFDPPVTRGVGEDRAPRHALAVTAIAMTLANGAANSLGAFLPAWAFKLGMSAGQSAVLLAVGAGLCVIGRVASGVAGDRRDGRNLPFVAAQMMVGAVGFVLLAQHDLRLVVVGALIAFGFGWSWPGLLLFAIVRIGRDRPASASGALMAGGFAGGAFGPPLFGSLVVATSYEVGWLVASGVLIAAAGLLLYARGLFLRDLAARPLA